VITARTAKDEMVGTFHGIDQDGNLVIITATGHQTVAAADVYFEDGGR